VPDGNLLWTADDRTIDPRFPRPYLLRSGTGRAGKQLATAARERFAVPVGHFHLRPVGPHPRGSVQLTIPPDQFGEFAQWLALNRDGLTIFVHANTGDDVADHTRHVIWFGPSESLRLELFGL
jgi:aromatic ring-cleaving dioxygenase